MVDLEALSISNIRSGGKKKLARVLAWIESNATSTEVIKLLDHAWAAPKAQVLGLTGPPGVGKSTLTNTLINELRQKSCSVGVIAVDPSSKISGGALLGDRTRISNDPGDPNIFIRSMAARDRLGGLSDQTIAAVILMRAIYDYLIVETVGIGQSESDINHIADTTILCVQPASGDSLQFMKSGIMELPDIILVTKADIGAAASRALSDLKGALSLFSYQTSSKAWQAPVLAVSASERTGFDELFAQITLHWQTLNEGKMLHAQRQKQALQWIRENIKTEYGKFGLRFLNEQSTDFDAPFQLERSIFDEIELTLNVD